MFESSREYRNSMEDSSYGPTKKEYVVYCDLLDEAGGIAAVTTILAINQISIKNIGITHNREFEEGALRIEFYEEQAGILARKVLKTMAIPFISAIKSTYILTGGSYVMQFQKAVRPLRGEISVPGDKSISHRAVMFGAISEGTTEVTNFYRVPTVSPPSPASAVWALRSRTRRSASSFMEKACTGFRLRPPFSTAETAEQRHA